MKNKWFSLSAWIEVIRIAMDNPVDANNNYVLIDSLLSVCNLKHSLDIPKLDQNSMLILKSKDILFLKRMSSLAI